MALSRAVVLRRWRRARCLHLAEHHWAGLPLGFWVIGVPHWRQVALGVAAGSPRSGLPRWRWRNALKAQVREHQREVRPRARAESGVPQ